MKLIYNGTGEHIPGIPAQDLSQYDIDRLIEGGLFISQEALIDGLTRNGLYRVDKPKRKSKTEMETDKE